MLCHEVIGLELGGLQSLVDRLIESFGIKQVRCPDRMPSRVQRILLHGASHLGRRFFEPSKPAKIETGVNPPRVT